MMRRAGLIGGEIMSAHAYQDGVSADEDGEMIEVTRLLVKRDNYVSYILS
jgi:hypothetical protein